MDLYTDDLTTYGIADRYGYVVLQADCLETLIASGAITFRPDVPFYVIVDNVTIGHWDGETFSITDWDAINSVTLLAAMRSVWCNADVVEPDGTTYTMPHEHGNGSAYLACRECSRHDTVRETCDCHLFDGWNDETRIHQHGCNNMSAEDAQADYMRRTGH